MSVGGVVVAVGVCCCLCLDFEVVGTAGVLGLVVAVESVSFFLSSLGASGRSLCRRGAFAAVCGYCLGCWLWGCRLRDRL